LTEPLIILRRRSRSLCRIHPIPGRVDNHTFGVWFVGYSSPTNHWRRLADTQSICVCNYTSSEAIHEMRHIVNTCIYAANSGATSRSPNNRGMPSQDMDPCIYKQPTRCGVTVSRYTRMQQVNTTIARFFLTGK